MNFRSQRGLTLTELVIVMTLAAMVTVGLVTFYLNSQGMWVDASTQALVQRDATLLVETLSKRVHMATSAQVINDPDSLHQTLFLFNYDPQMNSRFYWDPTDGLIHYDIGDPWIPHGPVVGSRVDRFQVDRNDTHVFLTRLRMGTNTGVPVELNSSMAFYNK
jgi:prepilin-type N-terminal cleavage/methylation domain-containing protein